jgi:hypothetical protein
VYTLRRGIFLSSKRCDNLLAVHCRHMGYHYGADKHGRRVCIPVRGRLLVPGGFDVRDARGDVVRRGLLYSDGQHDVYIEPM